MDALRLIKFESDDETIVWKHQKEDFSTASQLIVHETQEAVLFKKGQALDIFQPGVYTLKNPFHCEIYFINKTTSLNVMWGTSSKFQVLDPTFNIPLNVGASGSMEFLIKDSKKFLINVVGTQKAITTEKLIKYFREKISTKVKTYLAKIMSEVSYLAINQHLEEISQAMKEKLTKDFNDYGITIVNFYLSTIAIPNEDTDKVKEVLNKKMEYGILDYNWADEQIAEISKKYAENPGIQNDNEKITKMPITMVFGEIIKDKIANTIENQFSQKQKLFENSDEDNNTDNRDNNKNMFFFCECGREIEKDYVFCPTCGKKLNNPFNLINENKIESEIESKIDNDDKFCSKCGKELKK
ncbi:MAG: SPFH domain-containing protein [Methanobrevibacter sp.]|nr:SPFH domain-containing protein [Candidatus Methanoflexus mossambicus]